MFLADESICRLDCRCINTYSYVVVEIIIDDLPIGPHPQIPQNEIDKNFEFTYNCYSPHVRWCEFQTRMFVYLVPNWRFFSNF